MAESIPRNVPPVSSSAGAAPQASWLYRPEVRQGIYQALLVLGVMLFFYTIINNMLTNLRVKPSLSFWNNTAGFDIGQSLIEYASTASYGTAFRVGVWNTVLVASFGIFFATILGFLIGMARLSTNWLVARLATVYVELLRNIPLLLQLVFWYFVLLHLLPNPRQAFNVPGGGFFSNRGLTLPAPIPGDGFDYVLYALLLAIAGTIGLAVWASNRQKLTGQTFPTFLTGIGLVVMLPLITFLLLGSPLSFDKPVMAGFNLKGGVVVQPEFMALLLGLSLYTASFIAEIVRAGIQAVTKGQKEAAAALGLQPTQALRLVVIPQAMRVVIPPLTSQFLNLTKNSSLGLTIGYPDIVNITGTMGNQTGQEVVMVLITMGVFLSISLMTSMFMNWFNARVALVER
jgi:general L-amino acid transport system permease protein